MALKETLISLSTLATQPNPYGEVPPGTLLQADGVVMRKKGVLEPVEAFESLQSSTALAFKILPFYDQLIATQASQLEIFDDSTSTVETQIICGLYIQDITTSSFSNISNISDRQLLSTDWVVSAFDPTDTQPRPAGLPQPGHVSIDLTSSTAGNVLANNQWTAYRAHFLRDHGDGYVQVGAVSAPVAQKNTTGADIFPLVLVGWPFATPDGWPIREDDEVVVYRLAQQASKDALGDEYRECYRVKLTAGDIGTGGIFFLDTTLDDGRGAALYTNEFQEGAQATNFMPPWSLDICTFRGATFYLAQQGWQLVSLTVKNVFGALSTATEIVNGIGRRTGFVGTFTNGGTSVTGVAPTAGIADGQIISSGGFEAEVSSIVGAVITLTGPWPGVTGAAAFSVTDVLMGHQVANAANAVFNFGRATDSQGVLFIPDRLVSAENEEGLTFTLIRPVPSESWDAPFTVTGSNGQNYSPDLTTGVVSNPDERQNRLYFSKQQQPEAVPPTSYLDVGGGQILRMLATQSALYVYCTDGVYRITGDGTNFRVDPFDTTVTLLKRDALSAMGNTQYSWTNKGFTQLTDNGCVSLSENRIDDELKIYWDMIETSALTAEIVCDQFNREVWLNFTEGVSPTEIDPVKTYIYNEVTQALTTNVLNQHALCYYPFSRKITGQTNPPATSDYVITSTSVFSSPTITFSPFFAQELSDLKQWMTVTAFLQGTQFGVLQTTFNAVFSNFNLTNSTVICNYGFTRFNKGEKVIPVPKRKSGYKDLNLTLSGFPTSQKWKLFGLSLRYRTASETLHK